MQHIINLLIIHINLITYDLYHTNVTKLVKELGWERLELHRKINRFVVLHKAIKGEVAVPLPAELKRTTRKTRKKPAHTFEQFETAADCYKYIFFPRTIREWNSLQRTMSTLIVTISKSHHGTIWNYTFLFIFCVRLHEAFPVLLDRLL